jgi:hypothetical protein
MTCLCQRVYDTGFTGNPRIDARLAHQYEVYGQDCFKRAYDHANLHIPYTDTGRKPYCFVSKSQGVCNHEACEHGRYRPPDTVRKMRWWIEHTACKAAVHYPSFLEDESKPEVVSYGGTSFATHGEPTKYGTPTFKRRKALVSEGGEHHELVALIRDHQQPNDAAVAEREAWEDAMFRLHSRLEASTPHRTVTIEGRKTQQLPLTRTSIEDFRGYVAECVFGVASMEMGLHNEGEYLDAEERLNRRIEKFWADGFGDYTDAELQAEYDKA